MNYVRESDKAILSLYAIRDLFPNMSIPEGADLRDIGFSRLVPTDAPAFDPETQVLADGEPVQFGEVYQQGWAVASLTLPQIEARRKAAIPASVSPRQIRQALTRAGLRAPVEAGIAAGSQDMKDWYEFATAFERSHPMVGALAQGLGVSDLDLDNLFTLAGSL